MTAPTSPDRGRGRDRGTGERDGPGGRRGGHGDSGESGEMGRPGASPPHLQVPRVERPPAAAGASPGAFPWERAATAGPLLLADGSGPPEQATVVRAAWDEAALHVRFDCADRDAWGTLRQRNDPLYLEEAVEIFLAPGPAAPARYWEIEVSPAGVVFAAAIHNPTGRRADLVADTAWECCGLEHRTGPAGASLDWWAELAIPWPALAGAGGVGAVLPPAVWRANFYRIERPRGGRSELSCWSPTLTDPPDFHRPERFGVLELVRDSW